MPATRAVKEYAKAISEKLEIDEPDFSNFNETSGFIAENCMKYKKTVSDERIESQLEDICNICEEHFTDEFLHLLDSIYEEKGIYVFWNKDKIVYIGKSINLQSRVYYSLKERIKSENITHISLIYIEKEADLHIFEVMLITEYKPILNRDCVCGDYSNYFKCPADLTKVKKYKIFYDGD